MDITEPVDPGNQRRRGLLRVAGRPLVQHQLDLAFALSCQRVICLIRALEPEILELQHRTERAGMQFHAVAGVRDLSGLVTAADEIVAIDCGVMADPQQAASLLESAPGVLVQPAETGLAAGFERIDINNAAAGMLRIPGNLIEHLVRLPPDSAAIAALTRIALQAGIAMREVPAAARADTQWRAVTNESEAIAYEQDWLARKLAQARAVTPGRWLARQVVLWFGTTLLHAGNASQANGAGALAMIALALGLGWFGLAWAGLIVCAFAWIALTAARMLRSLEILPGDRRLSEIGALTLLDWMFDGAMILLVLMAGRSAMPVAPLMAFAPVMLLLVVRLTSLVQRSASWDWIGDRTVLALALALAAGLGVIDVAVRAYALMIVLALIVANRGKGG